MTLPLDLAKDVVHRDAAILVTAVHTPEARELALSYARESARVAVVSADPGELALVVAELIHAGCHDAVGIVADVTEPDGISLILDVIRKRWGQLNMLINPQAQMLLAQCKTSGQAQLSDPRSIILERILTVCDAAIPLLRRAAWGRIASVVSSDVAAHAAQCQRVLSVTGSLLGESIWMSIGEDMDTTPISIRY